MGKNATDAARAHEEAKANRSAYTIWCNKAWPPGLVLFVVTFVYGVFIVFNMLPQYFRVTGVKMPKRENDPDDYNPPKSQVYGVLISFHVLIVLLLTSFTRTALTSPGHIPLTDEWRNGNILKSIDEQDKRRLRAILCARQQNGEYMYTGESLEPERQFLKSLPAVERKLKMKKNNPEAPYELQLRFCSTCKLYKPDRTHHCSICNTCVLRMDHHCPWVATCVGFHNYKFFMLLLFYGWVCCGFVLVAMARRMSKTFRPIIDGWFFAGVDFPIILAYLISAFMFVALFLFFWFHVNLISKCLTTIEFREKQNSDRKLVQHRWEVAHMKFDLGSRYKNFTHVFGSWWMWLLPIQSNLAHDGTYVHVDG